MTFFRTVSFSTALPFSLLRRLVFAWALASTAHALDRLPYNHPGLVVDLGVGLWAWPMARDADDDGDCDLLVSRPDC